PPSSPSFISPLSLHDALPILCSAIARLLFSNLPGGSAYDFPNRASRHSLDCLKALPAIVSTVRRPMIPSNVRAPRSPEVCPRPYAALGQEAHPACRLSCPV